MRNTSDCVDTCNVTIEMSGRSLQDRAERSPAVWKILRSLQSQHENRDTHIKRKGTTCYWKDGADCEGYAAMNEVNGEYKDTLYEHLRAWFSTFNIKCIKTAEFFKT